MRVSRFDQPENVLWAEIDSGERIGRIALQQTNSRDTDAA